MLSAWGTKKKPQSIKVIKGFDLVMSNANFRYLAGRILDWRKEMIDDNRMTQEDIAKYDKHFGII